MKKKKKKTSSSISSNSEDEDGKDLLAPLRGALRRLHDPTSEETDEEEQSSPTTPTICLPGRLIIQYLRRGTRIVDETVGYPHLIELLNSTASLPKSQISSHRIPLFSTPVDEYMSVMLSALAPNTPKTPKITDFSPPQLSTALVFTIDIPRKENNSRNGQRLRPDVFWHFLLGSDSPHTLDLGYPAILDRNVQLIAYVLCASTAHFNYRKS